MDKEIKTVSASLNIEVCVDCPECEYFIDLLNPENTNDTYHNEDGFILKQACPDGHWIERHRKFEVNEVVCSECKTTFNVKELEW